MKKKELIPWCECHIIGIDNIDNTGEQLLCCAHLAEGICFVCPYTPEDINCDGKIISSDGYKDVDFKLLEDFELDKEKNKKIDNRFDILDLDNTIFEKKKN